MFDLSKAAALQSPLDFGRTQRLWLQVLSQHGLCGLRGPSSTGSKSQQLQVIIQVASRRCPEFLMGYVISIQKIICKQCRVRSISIVSSIWPLTVPTLGALAAHAQGLQTQGLFWRLVVSGHGRLASGGENQCWCRQEEYRRI